MKNKFFHFTAMARTMQYIKKMNEVQAMMRNLLWYGCECCGNDTFRVKNKSRAVSLKVTLNGEIYHNNKRIYDEDKHKYTCERCKETI